GQEAGIGGRNLFLWLAESPRRGYLLSSPIRTIWGGPLCVPPPLWKPSLKVRPEMPKYPAFPSTGPRVQKWPVPLRKSGTRNKSYRKPRFKVKFGRIFQSSLKKKLNSF